MNHAKIAELLRQLASLFDEETSHAPTAKSIKIEDVRSVLTRLSRKGRTAQVHDLLLSFGAEKLSSVNPEKYADLLAAAQELENAD